jgi:hypothetical protein
MIGAAPRVLASPNLWEVKDVIDMLEAWAATQFRHQS